MVRVASFIPRISTSVPSAELNDHPYPGADGRDIPEMGM